MRRARARCSSTAPSSRRTRSRRRPTAASTSARRRTARSTRSIATARATTFFDGDDKYIWALAVDAQGQPLRGHRRQGRDLQDRARRQGHDVLQDQGDARDGARLRQGRQPAGRHRHAGQGAAHRRRGQGVRPARFAVPGDPRAALRRQGRAVRRRDQRTARRAAAPRRSPSDTLRSADAATPAARRSPSVSAEITSIVDRRRRRRLGIDAARRARIAAPPKGAVYRIAPDGVWDQLWESRDDSPYDLTFDRSGALIVGTGNKGKIYRLEGDPLRPTLLARAAAQQVTAFYKDARGRLYYATANPGQAVPALVGAGRARHLRIGAARRADGLDLGRDQLARRRRRAGNQHRAVHAHRATPRRPTTPGARGRRPTPTPTARRSPARRRATCSGAPC